MLGKRRHFRVKGSYRITWGLEDLSVRGEGVVSNISMNGLEMTTKQDFNPLKGSVFVLEPIAHEIIPLQSKKAKMMWSEKILKDGIQWIQCGLEFIK